MTTITAKVIADSISPEGIRLTTFQLRYPLVIHAELMTHRVFSRNASSNRAIPVQKLIDEVKEDPFVPLKFYKNGKGMFPQVEVTDLDEIRQLKSLWLMGRDEAVDQAESLAKVGLHKQYANRVLMPYQHINVLVSSTAYENFFALRDHPDAMEEIQVLAREMKSARGKSTPKVLSPGDWHLPYVTETSEEFLEHSEVQGLVERGLSLDLVAAQCSSARCARVSFNLHCGKKADLGEDLKLYKKLVGSAPLHASPTEHQGTPDAVVTDQTGGNRWGAPHYHGNFTGWFQHRKMLAFECAPEPSLWPNGEVLH
ncbi:FAD-dependent thymidylate synthase [Kiloniella sp.]|uniref:FAD-dependent thymidylate synthase n=1 Tax=Kiloniella sp. TaxID=1938587 RepID=UPI003B02B45A